MGSQVCEKRLGGEDSDSSMRADREQMLLVACDEEVRARVDGAGQDRIVAWISCDSGDVVRPIGLRGRDPFE